MTYSNTSIEIVLIKNLTAKTGDDVIRIKKDLCTNEFDLTYTEYDNGKPNVYTMSGFHHKKVLDYVYMLLKNQYMDSEPYLYIQFNLPAMPCVIIPGENFREVYYREHFYDVISMGLDNLEYAYKKVEASVPRLSESGVGRGRHVFNSTMPGLRPQHIFFDD